MLYFKIQYGRPRVTKLFTINCIFTYKDMMEKPIEYNLDSMIRTVASTLKVTPECITLIDYDEYCSMSKTAYKT